MPKGTGRTFDRKLGHGADLLSVAAPNCPGLPAWVRRGWPSLISVRPNCATGLRSVTCQLMAESGHAGTPRRLGTVIGVALCLIQSSGRALRTGTRSKGRRSFRCPK